MICCYLTGNTSNIAKKVVPIFICRVKIRKPEFSLDWKPKTIKSHDC